MGLWRKLNSPTSRLTREGRARRRFNCAKQGEWGDRARTAGELLKSNRWILEATTPPLVIADFGAGNERLRLLLEDSFGESVEYRPYDLHPQLPTTVRLDVAKGLPDGEFDLGVCLGLLEYLPSVPALAQELGRTCRFAMVSYVTADSPVAIPMSHRLELGWANHLAGGELETAFSDAGFRSVGTRTAEGEGTTIWLWAAGPR